MESFNLDAALVHWKAIVKESDNPHVGNFIKAISDHHNAHNKKVLECFNSLESYRIDIASKIFLDYVVEEENLVLFCADFQGRYPISESGCGTDRVVMSFLNQPMICVNLTFCTAAGTIKEANENGEIDKSISSLINSNEEEFVKLGKTWTNLIFCSIKLRESLGKRTTVSCIPSLRKMFKNHFPDFKTLTAIHATIVYGDSFKIYFSSYHPSSRCYHRGHLDKTAVCVQNDFLILKALRVTSSTPSYKEVLDNMNLETKLENEKKDSNRVRLELAGNNVDTILDNIPSFLHIETDIVEMIIKIFGKDKMVYRRHWYKNLLEAYEVVEIEIGKKGATTLFATGSFCAAIPDGILEKFEHYKGFLGPDKAVTLFATDSFCAAISEGILEKFEHYLKHLGPAKAVTLFATGSFCASISEGILEKFEHYLKPLGPDKAVTLFATNSFCAAIPDGIIDKFEHYLKHLGPDKAVTLFSSNSFCAAIKEGILEMLKDDLLNKNLNTDIIYHVYGLDSFCYRRKKYPKLLERIQKFCKKIRLSTKSEEDMEILKRFLTGDSFFVHLDKLWDNIEILVDQWGLELVSNLFQRNSLTVELANNFWEVLAFIIHIEKGSERGFGAAITYLNWDGTLGPIKELGWNNSIKLFKRLDNKNLSRNKFRERILLELGKRVPTSQSSKRRRKDK